jgi:DNA-binding transcriptional LysR family regulator
VDLIAALRTFLRVAEVGGGRGAERHAAGNLATGERAGRAFRHPSGPTQHARRHAHGRGTRPCAGGEATRRFSGRVRLSVPVPLGLYFSSKLNSLLKKHDELSIDLILHDRLRDLIEEGIDLQVCVGEVNDSALISRRIGATTAFLVAAPDYLKGRAAPKEPADLQQHDCIVYHRWGRDDVWWFAGPEGAVSASVRGRFRANNSDAVRRAALNGHGIALLSHLLVADDISAGRLRVLMPAFPPARFPLTVVYPSRRNLPPRVRAVIEYLSEIVQADPAMRDDGAVGAVPHSEVSGPD